MAYQHITLPEHGERIRIEDDRLVVPDHPILGFVEGDGIGPDIMRACLRAWNTAVEVAYNGERKVHWTELYMGEKAARLYDGDYFPAETLQATRELIVSIKGPLTTPIGGGFRSLNVAMRQQLDLYACVRPVRYYQGVPSPVLHPEFVDVIIFRENTEDVYAGIEYQSRSPDNEKLARFLREDMGAEFFEDAGLGIKPISPFGSKRLVRKAIRYALDNDRESVTLVHKGNIMKFTEGAFRNWGYEVARDEFGDTTITEDELYNKHGGKRPEGKLVVKDRIADIMFQLMLLRPNEFDVVATPNLNGDYLSDAIAAEVGGMGIAPGANMADHIAVFEATHGTAPKYANMDKVNPGSLLFSGVLMFEYLGWKEAADLITAAYPEVIGRGIVTYDFARQMEGATETSTSGFVDALIAQMRGGVDVEARRAEHAAATEQERREREVARIAQPYAEMEASGRRPQTVGDIMSRLLVTVPHDTRVAAAMRLARQKGVSSVLVQPEGDGEWGIMTQRDVMARILNANRSPKDVSASDIATRPLITVPVGTSLRECSRRMLEGRIRRVVVLENGAPLGIVSDTDLFRIVDQFGWITE